MDRNNFTEFILQSDNDKNSTQEAKVEYHAWRLLLPHETAATATTTAPAIEVV